MSNDANKLRQRQEIRKYLVFAGMFLLFIGCTVSYTHLTLPTILLV